MKLFKITISMMLIITTSQLLASKQWTEKAEQTKKALFERYENPRGDLEVALNMAKNDAQRYGFFHAVLTCLHACCLGKRYGQHVKTDNVLYQDISQHRFLELHSPITFKQAPKTQFME